MPTDNVIPLFPRRDAKARRRRRVRNALSLAGACVIALAPMTVDAEGSGAARLPPGHPPVETHRLPPGHPPVQGGGGDATCTPGLPDGHPAVQDPRLPPGHPPVQLKPCTPDATSNGVYHPDVFSNDVKVIET